MAVAIEFFLTEIAGSAENIERHQHMVAHFKILYGRTDFRNDAGELMAKRRTDPGVRHKAMIKMNIGTTNASTRYTNNCIVGMFNYRLGFLLSANAIRTSVSHCQHEKLLKLI